MLLTERLLLEPWQPGDWIAFRPIAQDPEVMRYITGGVPWNDDQVRNFIERQISLHSALGFCRWKLIDRASGSLIGFCGGGMWRDLPDPEIGWWLAREFWDAGWQAKLPGWPCRI